MTAARHIAYRALRQVLEAGQHTNEALQESRLATLAPRDRAFVRMLLMAALRDYGRLKKLLLPWLKNPESVPPEIWALLVLGAAQLLILKTAPHAAVNETLELAVRENMSGLKGLLNAVLRRVDREGRTQFDQIPLTENFPEWLRRSWKSYPDRSDWPEILLTEPPLDITISQNEKNWAEKLGGELITPQTVRLEKSTDVTQLPGYEDGQWWIQDVAAALPVQMLGDIKGLNVLDLCAAPGGKTMQLLAGGAQVTAVDSSAQRLVKLKENLARTKLTADIHCADVMRFEPQNNMGQEFDVVLLDAPCTATGTLRRHPEILIHKLADDVKRLIALQQQMLDRAANWVKPGGRLLYCVCSLQREEGEEQIEAFLKSDTDFQLVKSDLSFAPQCITPDGTLRVLPNHFAGGADGFFAAVLKKN